MKCCFDLSLFNKLTVKAINLPVDIALGTPDKCGCSSIIIVVIF